MADHLHGEHIRRRPEGAGRGKDSSKIQRDRLPPEKQEDDLRARRRGMSQSHGHARRSRRYSARVRGFRHLRRRNDENRRLSTTSSVAVAVANGRIAESATFGAKSWAPDWKLQNPPTEEGMAKDRRGQAPDPTRQITPHCPTAERRT